MAEKPKPQQQRTKSTKTGKAVSTASSSKPMQSERNEGDASTFRRVDHTPPPLYISEGSIIVETDRDFDTRTQAGGAAHRHQHIFNNNRTIQGLKILDDAGDTIYLNGDARGCSVKIWWRQPTSGPEQIFVDANTFTVETDEELSASTPTGHTRPKRERRHMHPNANANELLQVAVVNNNGDTVFFEKRRLAQVMIWDTRD